MKVYQPIFYIDDGTNIEYRDIPDELKENEVFSSQQACRDWLKEHDYFPDNFIILEKNIKNPIIIL